MDDHALDLAGIGSMVVDSIHRPSRVIGPDEKALLEADRDGHVVRRYVGGVTLNHLGWARLFGGRVAIFGKQADDENGRFLRAGMARLGIDVRLDLSGGASSFAQVYVGPGGERAIYMARAATGEITRPEIDERHRPVIESAAVVSTEISQLPLDVVCRVIELARTAGATTVIDLDVPLSDAVPALGSEADFHRALEGADLIKPSLHAARALLSVEDPDEIAVELSRRYGARAVLITLGEEGSVGVADGTALRERAAEIEAVDTTGAGDAFLGGVLAGRRLDLDWRDAVRLGNACGAACCEREGAFPDEPESLRLRALELFAELGGGSLALDPIAVAPAGAADPVSRLLRVATDEVRRAAETLDRGGLDRARDLIRRAQEKGGRVHVTGVGKCEHVARYAASLLSSVGTPATFLHATEGTHGSVGQLRADDVVIGISNSGETLELLACVEAALGMGATLIAVTGERSSTLARRAEQTLAVPVEEEGGPLGLAPRASTLVQSLVIAALSVALQDADGFTRADYHRRHPGGALGSRSGPD